MMDFAFVLVRHSSGKEAVSQSVGVPIPQSVYSNLEIDRNDGLTLGDVSQKYILEHKHIDIDPKDPHHYLCGISREECLTQTISVALGSLLFQFQDYRH